MKKALLALVALGCLTSQAAETRKLQNLQVVSATLSSVGRSIVTLSEGVDPIIEYRDEKPKEYTFSINTSNVAQAQIFNFLTTGGAAFARFDVTVGDSGIEWVEMRRHLLPGDGPVPTR